MLMQAYQDRVLLSLKLSEDNTAFHTAIIGVYPKHGFLVLDEIKPAEGNALLLEQKEIQLSGLLDGVALAFKTSIVETGIKSSITFYKAGIPGSLYFRQRRNYFRVAMSSTKIPFNAYHTVDAREALSGYILDLTTAGIGVILDDEHSLCRGDLIPTCTLRLPGVGNFIFSLRISFSHPNPERGVTRIGGQFQALDKASQQKLRKAINKNERLHAKRQKKR